MIKTRIAVAALAFGGLAAASPVPTFDPAGFTEHLNLFPDETQPNYRTIQPGATFRALINDQLDSPVPWVVEASIRNPTAGQVNFNVVFVLPGGQVQKGRASLAAGQVLNIPAFFNTERVETGLSSAGARNTTNVPLQLDLWIGEETNPIDPADFEFDLDLPDVIEDLPEIVIEIPTPGAAGLFAVGGLAMAGRRRR